MRGSRHILNTIAFRQYLPGTLKFEIAFVIQSIIKLKNI
jgi:hypothetical protein